MNALGVHYDDLRRGIAEMMWQRGEWAGCPVPIDGLRLSIESKNPYAARLQAIATTVGDESSGLLPGERIVNRWYCRRRQCEVYVVHTGDPASPRAEVFTLPKTPHEDRFHFALQSLQATWVHDVEAEVNATVTLSRHVNDQQYRYYMLLGYFLETSKRSGVSYLFRKGRPTVAFRVGQDPMPSVLLAALCLHPIAYYETTHVGAMTPTDDVLAHLLMMRGDEHLFWRRANQHPLHTPQAAL